MGVYIHLDSSITKEMVIKDENLEIKYDGKNIIGIQLKENDKAWATWVGIGHDDTHIFKVGTDECVELFNYLFHKYGFCYHFDDELYEACMYEEDDWERSCMYTEMLYEHMDDAVDYYTKEEQETKEKYLNFAKELHKMYVIRFALNTLYHIDERLERIYGIDDKIKEDEYNEFKSMIGYLESLYDTTFVYKEYLTRIINGIKSLDTYIEKGEITIIPKEKPIEEKNIELVLDDDYGLPF